MSFTIGSILILMPLRLLLLLIHQFPTEPPILLSDRSSVAWLLSSSVVRSPLVFSSVGPCSFLYWLLTFRSSFSLLSLAIWNFRFDRPIRDIYSFSVFGTIEEENRFSALLQLYEIWDVCTANMQFYCHWCWALLLCFSTVNVLLTCNFYKWMLSI